MTTSFRCRECDGEVGFNFRMTHYFCSNPDCDLEPGWHRLPSLYQPITESIDIEPGNMAIGTESSPAGQPPVGVRPHWLWIEQRIAEVYRAIGRYEQAQCDVPQKWFDEGERLFKLLREGKSCES